MENAQVADVLEEIADLLEMQEENQFRIRSYRSAARSVRDLSRRLEDLIRQGEDLAKLPSIGKSTAEKIHEILERGTCARLEELRRQLPPGLNMLMRVPRLGPRKAMAIYQALEVTSLDELRRACEQHRIRDLPGMGEKTEDNILQGLKTLASTAGRILYRTAAEHVASLGRHLDGLDAVEHWDVAGSFRRRMETIGDLDILVQAHDRPRATEQILGYAPIREVVSRGLERITVILESGLQVDFRFFEPRSFGSALMYFTGSKAHNIALRKRALQHGWKLNEYGLLKDERHLAGATEESVYRKLGLPWIPPELREDRGEVEAAERGALPRLIEPGDLRGDLQAHTTETDGAATVEEMAQAAIARGYEYLAITDHSRAVTMAKGLDEDRLRRHADHIRTVDQSLGGTLWLLAGVEVDILKDGRLDLGEKVLGELDWVLASVHYHQDLDDKQMTARLLRAVRSGVVHCLGHPLSRLIGKREAIRFDVDRVFEACREHGVWVEINAQPERLDLPDTYCKRALEAGLGLTISTDAHRPAELDFMPLGVNVARRGWVEKQHVLNTLPVAAFRRRIARR